MRELKPLTIVTFALVALLTLAGCDSAEERAEEHFQNGLALIEAGDHDRALVELRNVFQLDGSHRDARRTLAEMLLEHFGKRQDAYSEYLRLVEQYPDDLEGRIALSEIAFSAARWDEVERHGSKAEELAPDDPRVRAISVARAYRAAAVEEDMPAIREQARIARDMLETLPDNALLRNIVIDADLRNGEYQSALEGIDWILERNPDDLRYWQQRLSLLARMEDFGAVEAQLRDMVDRFPDDLNNKRTLIRFYMTRNEMDKAEDFLRHIASESPQEAGPRVDLIQFLSEVRGAKAAFAEIDAAIDDPELDPLPFLAIRGSLAFEQGNRDTAIATLESALEGAEPSDQTRNVKVALARMLVAMNNNVGARAHIEEVLAEDPTHAEALKMQAAWKIEADDTDGAIAALRTALDQEPEDAGAMTLMAEAYNRSGRPELARDFFALAVEASGNAPAETLRYARLLMEDENYLTADDILLTALRLAPDDLDILMTLGQVYLGMEDFDRVEQVVQTLQRLDVPRATEAANALETERLNRQSGPQEALAYLEGLAGSADATLATRISVLSGRVSTGDLEGALDLARELLAEDPGNPALKRVLATTEALNGNLETAETLYRELLETNPNAAALWLELSRLKLRQGDPEMAKAVVDQSLEQNPDDPNLMWAKASYLERENDVEGAIAIYEELYARNSSSIVVANNLASLLSTYREDDESLERAWVVARRFSDTDIPAMQDTYGWIEHRRGNSDKALSYMEAAAEGLPGDPLVQYHLGQVYLALNRQEEALDQFRRAVTLAGPADSRTQIKEARARIADLNAKTGEGEGN